MSEAKFFRGGTPYALDIKRLSEFYPVSELNEGRILPHEELEAILDIKRGTSRYYGVIDAWIGRQRNINGLVIVWEREVGLKVLDPVGVLDHAETRTRQKTRQLGRAVRIFGLVDRERLNAFGQQRLDHQMLVTGKLAQFAHNTRKEMAIQIGPIQSLPKRPLPPGIKLPSRDSDDKSAQ